MRSLVVAILILLTATTTALAQAANRPATQAAAQAARQTPKLRGRVLDSSGAVIPGAKVQVFQGSNLVKEVLSNSTGDFELDMPAGEYRLEVAFVDFNTHIEMVRVTPNMRSLAISMSLGVFATTVEVTEDPNAVELSLDSSLGTTTLSGSELEDLPDNEDELAAYLQDLAAASGGAESAVTFNIDGFTGGGLPPRDQIQQIVIENNPFSAAGGGDGPRIRIITRPGTGTWRGGASFSFRDESLNAKAASATDKPSSQRRNFSMQMSGPVIAGRLSMSFQGSKQESESEGNSIQAFTPFGIIASGVVSPSNTISLNPRFQLYLNQKNSVNFNFNYSKTKSENQGIGGFVLPERASNSNRNQFRFQVSENAQIGAWNNELRFQMNRNTLDQTPVKDAVTINVVDAFSGGGNANRNNDLTKSYQFADQLRTALADGKWQINSGVELNHSNKYSVSTSNYLGTYTFSSIHDYCKSTGYEGVNCQPTRSIVETAQAQGVDPAYANSRGQVVAITGVPSQFTITSGDPVLGVNQTEFNAFMENTWRVSQKLSAQMGLRYQMQTHLKDYNNISPRLNLRYQVRPRTIISGGSGLVFAETGFSINNYEQLLRNDGTSRQFQTVITTFNPVNPFGVAGGTTTRTNTQIRTRAADLVSPYTIQSRISVEERLPKQIGLTVAFQSNRGIHQLRTRNINAPLPGTKVRPDPTRGNILQYESTATSRSNNLSFTFRQNLRVGLWNLNMNGTYTLGWSKDDGVAGGGGGLGGFGGGGGGFGGGGTLPSDNYNLASDWGRSNNDQRHRFRANITINMPWHMSIRVNPTVNSGRPYNITTGKDDNGDTTINDRPVGVPRNSGTGPSNNNVSLNFSKTFALQKRETSTPAAANTLNFAEPQRGGGGGGFPDGGGQGGQQRGPQGGQGGQRRGPEGGQGGQRPANNNGPRMTLNIQVSNVLNHPQNQIQSSVLTSPFFGQITGNQPRSVTLSLNFQDLF